jgi:hypothetical protein
MIGACEWRVMECWASVQQHEYTSTSTHDLILGREETLVAVLVADSMDTLGWYLLVVYRVTKGHQSLPPIHAAQGRTGIHTKTKVVNLARGRAAEVSPAPWSALVTPSSSHLQQPRRLLTSTKNLLRLSTCLNDRNALTASAHTPRVSHPIQVSTPVILFISHPLPRLPPYPREKETGLMFKLNLILLHVLQQPLARCSDSYRSN